MKTKQIEFPTPNNLKCLMMPFVQGDSNTLPKELKAYSKIIEENFLEFGEVGFLTIDESFIGSGKTQRGYNSKGIERNVHIEAGSVEKIYCWGSSKPSWGGRISTILDENTRVLIANNISNTCKVWDTIERSYTKDGDLSDYIDKYSEKSGYSLKSGELANISIFTPHECVAQVESANRQFFRIVGKGVTGREDYFTKNPLVSYN